MIATISKQGGRKFALGSLAGPAVALTVCLRVTGTTTTVPPIALSFTTWNAEPTTLSTYRTQDGVITWNVEGTTFTTWKDV